VDHGVFAIAHPATSRPLEKGPSRRRRPWTTCFRCSRPPPSNAPATRRNDIVGWAKAARHFVW